jgi:hypothetical protein
LKLAREPNPVKMKTYVRNKRSSDAVAIKYSDMLFSAHWKLKYTEDERR